ncbi:hypothetical protein HID58_079487, partial [Brassica napus]
MRRALVRSLMKIKERGTAWRELSKKRRKKERRKKPSPFPNAKPQEHTLTPTDTRVGEEKQDRHIKGSQNSVGKAAEKRRTTMTFANNLKERREVHLKNVWNRLDSGQYSELPRNRYRYHPYQHNSGAISKESTRDTASSSEWRPKRPQGDKYDKQPARPWNQTNTSFRSRRSPDSQRTISDNPRRQSSHAHARGRNSRSPPSGTLEWRPINRHRETGAPRGFLKKGDNPVNLTQLSENDDAEKQPALGVSLKFMNLLTHGFDQKTEKEKETEREKEDRELENEINEYTKLADLADLDMTEDMINQDDLLDEMELLKEHTRDDEMEDGRIEAISQLSPERQCTKTQMAIGKKTANHEVEKGEIVEERETVEQVKQDPKNKASAQQTSTLGKKRGARSPDLKGASASRKLASRGRFSPKSKVMKPARETISTAQK